MGSDNSIDPESKPTHTTASSVLGLESFEHAVGEDDPL